MPSVQEIGRVVEMNAGVEERVGRNFLRRTVRKRNKEGTQGNNTPIVGKEIVRQAIARQEIVRLEIARQAIARQEIARQTIVQQAYRWKLTIEKKVV